MALKPEWLSKLAGTVRSIFQIGGPTGVSLKNNSAVLEVKNAADSAFTGVDADNIRLVDPANTSRKIDLSSPTLAAGWDATLPPTLGEAGQVMRRTGTRAMEWAWPRSMRHSISLGVDPYGSLGTGPSLNINSDGRIETLYSFAKQDWVDTLVAANTTYVVGTAFPSVPFLPIDVIAYHDDATHSMAVIFAPWQNTGITKTITGITNASPPVWTVGASHGFTVGKVVCVQGITSGPTTFNNRLFRVSAVAGSTVTLIDIDGAALTASGVGSSGTMYEVKPQSSRASGYSIGIIDGVYGGNIGGSIIGPGNFLIGKLLGTICPGPSLNTLYSTHEYPFIMNPYNRRQTPVGNRPLGTTADNWTLSSNTHTPTDSRPINGYWGKGRQWWLSGTQDMSIDIDHVLNVFSPAGASLNTTYVNYLSIDANANFDPSNTADFSFPGSITHTSGATAADQDREISQLFCQLKMFSVVEGLHFAQAMEFVHGSGTSIWSVWRNFSGGSNNQYSLKGGFRGFIDR